MRKDHHLDYTKLTAKYIEMNFTRQPVGPGTFDQADSKPSGCCAKMKRPDMQRNFTHTQATKKVIDENRPLKLLIYC